MSSSSVLANLRVYRHLLKVSRSVSQSCELGNPEGFMQYVGNRFRVVAEANRKARIRPNELKKHRAMVVHYSTAMKEAVDDAELTSILNALGAGIGSSVYKRSLEKGFFDLVLFRKRMIERGEADEEQTSDKQNRIMQAAISPLADKLTNLHKGYSVPELRDKMSSTKAGTSVAVLSHGSAEVVIEIDDELNKQTLFVRVDDDEFIRVMLRQSEIHSEWLAKYAGMKVDTSGAASVDSENDVNGRGPSTANLHASSGNADIDHAQNFSIFNERVEVSESDLIRGTTLHAHWGGIAMRLLDAIIEEMPLHRSRSTVIVGHGVGGAVALVLGLQLHTMGFDIKNVIQFGSPRVVQDTLNRYVTAINPLRVVINGDPCTQGPVTTSEGESFVHVGEVLMLDLPVTSKFHAEGDDGEESDGYDGRADADDEDSSESRSSSSAADAGSNSNNSPLPTMAKRYDAHRYASLLRRDDVDLVYAEGDDSFMEPEWKASNRRGGEGMVDPLVYDTMHGKSPSTFDK